MRVTTSGRDPAAHMTASGRKPRIVVGYDGSELAKAALRGAAELFPGSPTVVVTVWEPGLGAMVAAGTGMDAAGALPLPPDPELVSEVDHAEEHHAAVVAREGAQLAGSLGLDAEPHAIPDRLDVADTIVDVASKRDAASRRHRLARYLGPAVATAWEHLESGPGALPAPGRGRQVR